MGIKIIFLLCFQPLVKNPTPQAAFTGLSHQRGNEHRRNCLFIGVSHLVFHDSQVSSVNGVGKAIF
jgi:hypothetical protein